MSPILGEDNEEEEEEEGEDSGDSNTGSESDAEPDNTRTQEQQQLQPTQQQQPPSQPAASPAKVEAPTAAAPQRPASPPAGPAAAAAAAAPAKEKQILTPKPAADIPDRSEVNGNSSESESEPETCSSCGSSSSSSGSSSGSSSCSSTGGSDTDSRTARGSADNINSFESESSADKMEDSEEVHGSPDTGDDEVYLCKEEAAKKIRSSSKAAGKTEVCLNAEKTPASIPASAQPPKKRAAKRAGQGESVKKGKVQKVSDVVTPVAPEAAAAEDMTKARARSGRKRKRGGRVGKRSKPKTKRSKTKRFCSKCGHRKPCNCRRRRRR